MSGDARLGTSLAGYRIESVIGRGGMGVVYLAEHLRLGRKVALKVLPPELGEDERFRDRFIHESKLAASLDHPHIVDIYDAGEADGLLYLAMRYVGGSDLRTLIHRDGPLEPARTVALLTQVASALDAAHDRGLVHRDVKSANVLIEPSSGSLGEHAYLTDFGLTKRPESMSGLTKTGQFLGSVEYAAPEQFEGRPIDARTDIYSLGCVAYESLTAEVPFPRDSEAAVMYAHLRDAPPRISGRRPGLPAGLDAVAATAMAKRPADRYPSAGQFAEELAKAARGEPQAGPRRPGPRRRFLAFAAAGLVIVLALLGFLLFKPSGGQTGGGSHGSPSPSVGTGPGTGLLGALRLDTNGHVVARISQPLTRSDVSFDKAVTTGEGTVWLWDGQVSRLYKIAPSTNSVIGDPVTVIGANTVVVGSGSLWFPPDFFLSPGTNTSRIDPHTNQVTHQIDMPDGCCRAAAYGSGALWVLGASNTLRIDPDTNRIVKRLDVVGQDVTVADGTVWVLDTLQGRLIPIDAKTNEVGGSIPLEGSPLKVAAGGGAVWVAGNDGKVQKITPGGGVDSVQLDGRLNDIFFDPSGVWVASPFKGTVWKLDPVAPATNPQKFSVGGIPSHVTVGEGGVWVVEEPPSNIWSS